MNRIRVESENLKIEIDFDLLDNPTAKKISESLPIMSQASTWGDEIYFDTGISAPAENATLDVDVGDIAYWPEGRCLCVFFGSTPVSSGDKPVPASEVVIVGKADVDPEELRKVGMGDRVIVE
ncbi:cyclophilin-like fold protein [Candidatus Omnitrophota bacterium]